MGTNFYTRHIPTIKEREQMEAFLITSQWNKLKKVLEESTKSYHIGKRSGGWQFLFAPHICVRNGIPQTGRIVSPWENTLASLQEYLSREDVEIYNEHGDKFTSNQFWNEEIGYCLYNDPEKAINSRQYYEKHPEDIKLFYEPFDFTTEEGLRFSKDADFS